MEWNNFWLNESCTNLKYPHNQPVTLFSLEYFSCDADPAALAKYVVALVKKDKPVEELKDICVDQLEVFLSVGNIIIPLREKSVQIKMTYFSLREVKSKSWGWGVLPNITYTLFLLIFTSINFHGFRDVASLFSRKLFVFGCPSVTRN